MFYKMCVMLMEWDRKRKNNVYWGLYIFGKLNFEFD